MAFICFNDSLFWPEGNEADVLLLGLAEEFGAGGDTSRSFRSFGDDFVQQLGFGVLEIGRGVFVEKFFRASPFVVKVSQLSSTRSLRGFW
jgi:hypothetical protein